MCERYDKKSINVSINNLYSLFYSKDRYFIDFTSRNDITPQAGIYIVFDKKDVTNAYSKGRVVRIGESVNIHERIYKHCSNKNLSRFRRMLGTAVLVDAQKRYLSLWNDEETSESDFPEIRKQVDEYMEEHFLFLGIPVFDREDKTRRKNLEARLISTFSWWWFYNKQPASTSGNLLENIPQSGLWLSQSVFQEPVSKDDIKILESAISRIRD